jgi:outer membrane protein TolC
METALARALQANPDVQVALATVQRQDGLRLQSVALLVPHLVASSSLDWRATSLTDLSPNELATAPSLRTAVADRSIDARIELRQSIFDGLASWHQVRRMAMLQKKASMDARDLYLKVASQVRQLYDAVLLRQSIVTARRGAVRDLGHLAEVAQRRYGAGEVSEYESLRAQSTLRSAEADLAQAESEWARMEEQFCRMLYVDKPPGGLRLAGSVTPVEFNQTFDSALSEAKMSRFDLRSAELQLDAARMAQRVAVGSLLPHVEAFVGYDYRSSYFDFNRRLDGWTAGVVGRWDIFDGGQTAGSIRVQRADRRVAEIRLAETQRLIGSQLRELFAALNQSRTVMAAQATARDLAERAQREAQRTYEAGRLSIAEVLNANIAFRQAELSYLGAVFNYNTTVYQLDYATGSEAFLDHAAPAKR